MADIDIGLKFDQPVIVYAVAIVLVLVTVLGGFLGTMHLTDYGEDEVNEESEAFVNTLGAHISSQIMETENAVRAMSGTQQVIDALNTGSAANISKADAVLDNFKVSFNVTVCYLMNTTGVTIASTNRDSDGSFVGKNYGFRPYFQQAIEGEQGSYFAVGVTSGTRGYYASYPVKNAAGSIVGVAVIKKELDALEKDFENYEYCFFVSPEGVIFLSSDADLLFMSLTPMKQTVKDVLITSKQFGNGTFKNFLDDNVKNGDEVDIDGDPYHVTILQTHEEGWSIVLCNSLETREKYRSIGILLTVFSLILVAGFIFFFWSMDKSIKTMSENEKIFHKLQSCMFEGVLVQEDGTIIKANQQIASILGYEVPELLGKKALAFVAPDSIELVKKNMEIGYRNPYEIDVIRKDGGLVHLKVSGRSFPYRGRNVRVVAAQRYGEAEVDSTSSEQDATMEGPGVTDVSSDKVEDPSNNISEGSPDVEDINPEGPVDASAEEEKSELNSEHE